MLEAINRNYGAYKTDPDDVDEDELFEVTLYTHQVHKLRQKDKLTESDIKILKDSIQALRQIQVEFVENEASLRRFDIMFKDPEPEKRGSRGWDSPLISGLIMEISERRSVSQSQLGRSSSELRALTSH